MRIDFSMPMEVRRPDIALAALQADARVLTSSFRINSTGDIAGGFDVGGVFRVRIGGVVALATNAARTVTLVETAEDALAQIDTRLTEIRRLVGDRTGVFLDILA